MADGDTTDFEPLISFLASNGDVVTSLLSILAGLVRQCQGRRGSGSSSCENGTERILDQRQQHCRIIPPGISVVAIGVVEETTLVKVPPQCFLQMLDKFPRDVHQIAQTIIARMQRVTLQTMVRCLGLQNEIVQRYNLSSTAKLDHVESVLSTMFDRPQTWERLQSSLSNYIPGSSSPNLRDQVEEDTAWMAAVSLFGKSAFSSPSEHRDKLKVRALVESLQRGFRDSLSRVAQEAGLDAGWERVEWLRDEGKHGGGSRYVGSGSLFNRAAINVSQVHYDDLPEKPLGSANAISTIIHPANPHAPSMHMHISWTGMKSGKGYWRVMADLNPSIPDQKQTDQFLAALELLSGELFAEGKAQGEKYFYIPALERHRGVAHFYLEGFDSGDFAADLTLNGKVGCLSTSTACWKNHDLDWTRLKWIFDSID